ncbi:MAG: hypothetical protein ACP5OC_08080 [Thermoplasmata archaeon]
MTEVCPVCGVTVRSAGLEELESRLNTLSEEWSKVVAHPEYEINGVFDVFEKQVECVIRDCGYSVSKNHSDDTRGTLGDMDTGLEIFYCNPGVVVIISYSFQIVVFENGDKDTEMRLRGIRVVSVW